MNGARALIQTLADAGVDVCFSNPGTSEMHFVAALEQAQRRHGGIDSAGQADDEDRKSVV